MWNKRLFVMLLSALFLSVLGLGAEEGKSYYAPNRQNGLSSNCVLQMLQLRDGRMVVVTDKAVDVYDGHALLTVAPPYVEQLTFSHDQNSLAFQFSTMNYVRPRSTCYRYRFSGDRGAVAPPSTMAIPLSFGVSFSPTSMLLQGNKIIENARGSLWAGSRTSWQTAWQRNWGMKNLYAPTRGQCSAWRFPADGRHA